METHHLRGFRIQNPLLSTISRKGTEAERSSGTGLEEAEPHHTAATARVPFTRDDTSHAVSSSGAKKKGLFALQSGRSWHTQGALPASGNSTACPGSHQLRRRICGRSFLDPTPTPLHPGLSSSTSPRHPCPTSSSWLSSGREVVSSLWFYFLFFYFFFFFFILFRGSK